MWWVPKVNKLQAEEGGEGRIDFFHENHLQLLTSLLGDCLNAEDPVVGLNDQIRLQPPWTRFSACLYHVLFEIIKEF